MTGEEEQIVDTIWGANDSRPLLTVSLGRNGKIEMRADYERLPLYIDIVVGDLLTRIAAMEQGRRRAEAHQ